MNLLFFGTNKIICTMNLKNENFIISIKDFGKGFLVDAINKGNGMRTMRERVESLNGSYSIISNPGQGTEILAEIKVAELKSN